MSDTKHTPGPWECRKGTPQITHRWNGRDVVIADVVRPGWHEDRLKAAEEAGANAELIAAAPETRAKLDELIEAVWACPADEANELQASHEETVAEAVRDTMKGAKLDFLVEEAIEYITNVKPHNKYSATKRFKDAIEKARAI